MAAYEKRVHKFTEGATTYTLMLPNVYEGNNSTIASAVGIDVIAEGNEPPDGSVPIEVSAALKSGLLVRLRISHFETATNKTKSAKILCPISQAKTAIGLLPSKTYLGNDIRGAGIPRRRRLG